MPEDESGSFSPADINALRLLAIALGVVVTGLLWLQPDEPYLIIGMATAMMVSAIGAVFLLRKLRKK